MCARQILQLLKPSIPVTLMIYSDMLTFLWDIILARLAPEQNKHKNVVSLSVFEVPHYCRLAQAIHIATRTARICFLWGQNQREAERQSIFENTGLTLIQETDTVRTAGTTCPIWVNSHLSKEKTRIHSFVTRGSGSK